MAHGIWVWPADACAEAHAARSKRHTSGVGNFTKPPPSKDALKRGLEVQCVCVCEALPSRASTRPTGRASAKFYCSCFRRLEGVFDTLNKHGFVSDYNYDHWLRRGASPVCRASALVPGCAGDSPVFSSRHFSAQKCLRAQRLAPRCAVGSPRFARRQRRSDFDAGSIYRHRVLQGNGHGFWKNAPKTVL